MPRTALTPVSLPSAAANTVAPQVFTWASADVANGNQVALTGEEVLLVWNSDAASQTVTITSARLKGRLANAPAASLAAGAYAVWPQFPVAGWGVSGQLQINASHANVKFAVLKLIAS